MKILNVLVLLPQPYPQSVLIAAGVGRHHALFCVNSVQIDEALEYGFQPEVVIVDGSNIGEFSSTVELLSSSDSMQIPTFIYLEQSNKRAQATRIGRVLAFPVSSLELEAVLDSICEERINMEYLRT